MHYNIITKKYPDGTSAQVKTFSSAIEKGNVDNLNYSDMGFIKTDDCKLISNKKKKKTKKQESAAIDKRISKELDPLSVERSQRRAIQCIYDLARSNVWEYFITLTFDKEKVDRYNYDKIVECVKKWRDDTRLYAPNMKSLIIPELHNSEESECKCGLCGTIYKNSVPSCPNVNCNGQHTDKLYAFHFHGLISNIGELQLKRALSKNGKLKSYKTIRYIEEFDKDTGEYSRYKTEEINPIYNFTNFDYGFTEISTVKNSKRAANYIAKYVTKALCYDPRLKDRKKYWGSRNLEKPELFYKYLPKEEKALFEEKLREATKDTYSKEYTVNLPNKTFLSVGIYEVSDIRDFITEDILVIEESEEKKGYSLSSQPHVDFTDISLNQEEDDYTEDMLNTLHPIYDDKNDFQVKILQTKVKLALMQNRKTEKELLSIEERYNLKFNSEN